MRRAARCRPRHRHCSRIVEARLGVDTGIRLISTFSMKDGALVITGGSRGIGAEIARQASRQGTSVALIYQSRADAAARVVGEIEAQGGRAQAFAADVGDEASVEQ